VFFVISVADSRCCGVIGGSADATNNFPFSAAIPFPSRLEPLLTDNQVPIGEFED